MKTCFYHLTVVWRPLAEKQIAISTQSIHRWKVHLLGYTNPSLTIRVYLHSFSCYCLRNTTKCREISREFDLTAVQKVIDLGDFLLVINCNFSRISATVFEIITLKDRKLLILPTPLLFDAPLGNSLFLDETYPAKTRGIGLPYGENFIILTSTVFLWYTRVTDRQTGGQTGDSI